MAKKFSTLFAVILIIYAILAIVGKGLAFVIEPKRSGLEIFNDYGTISVVVNLLSASAICWIWYGFSVSFFFALYLFVYSDDHLSRVLNSWSIPQS